MTFLVCYSPAHHLVLVGIRYTPQKNKQRLLLKKVRRKGAKQARGSRTDGLIPERKEVLVGQGVRGSISDGQGAAIRDFETREGRDG